ncbi:hypothetical protein NPIL_392941, partial [Nephila pilipes]
MDARGGLLAVYGAVIRIGVCVVKGGWEMEGTFSSLCRERTATYLGLLSEKMYFRWGFLYLVLDAVVCDWEN